MSIKECNSVVKLEHGEIINCDLFSAKFDSNLNMNNIDTKCSSKCEEVKNDELNTSDINCDLVKSVVKNTNNESNGVARSIEESVITNENCDCDEEKDQDNSPVSSNHSHINMVEERNVKDPPVVNKPGDSRLVCSHMSECDANRKDPKFQSSQKNDKSLLADEDLDCVSELEISDIPLTQTTTVDTDSLNADICNSKTGCVTPRVFNGMMPKQRHVHQMIRRVPISPRVDVILHNDLFRKHLTKYDHGLFAHQKSRCLGSGISCELLSNSNEINDMPFSDILNTQSLEDFDTDVSSTVVQTVLRKEEKKSEDKTDIENLENQCEKNCQNIPQFNKSELSSCKTLPRSYKPKNMLNSQDRVRIPSYEEFRSVRKSKTVENLNAIARADDLKKSINDNSAAKSSSASKSSSVAKSSSMTHSSSETKDNPATESFPKKIIDPMLDMELAPSPIKQTESVLNGSQEKNCDKEISDDISVLEDAKDENISTRSLECAKSDSEETSKKFSDTAKRKSSADDPSNGEHPVGVSNQYLDSSSNIGHLNLPNLSDDSEEDLPSDNYQNAFLDDKIGKANSSIDTCSSCNSSLRLSDITTSPYMLVESEDDGVFFEEKISNMSDREYAEDNDKGSEESITQIQIIRSTSDVSDLTATSNRRKHGRKTRPYKSDPFTGTRPVPSDVGSHLRGSSEDLKEASLSSPQTSLQSLEELSEEDVDTDSERKLRKRLSNVSVTSIDSGVIGQEGTQEVTLNPQSFLSRSATTVSLHSQTSFGLGDKVCECVMCCAGNQNEGSTSLLTENVICDRCQQKLIQRKKTIHEIVTTEINYGRDLNILKQEFYEPMKMNGLMTAEQLETIFSNLDDLSHVNLQFVEKIETAIQEAYAQEDQTMNNVNIGSLFLESSTMFLTFESYCVNQAQAPVLLEQLEKEKELLRIFLLVSQTENSLLRRMHLRSFLIVPVQRIMKYPLLLERLYKCTPNFHPDRNNVRKAKDKIEEILEHINAKTKGSMKLKRKGTELRKISITEKIEVNRVALEILGWKRKDVCDVLTSRLWIAVPQDHTWIARHCKNLKFSPVHAVLLTLGQARLLRTTEDQLLFPKTTDIREAAVVLIREKNGKFHPVRDPFHLEKCVLTVTAEVDDVFELMEWNKEAYLLKAEDILETKMWIQHLKRLTRELSMWRRRRNGQANIMIQYIP